MPPPSVSWVNNFRETGDVKKKKPGLPQTARSPQNIEAVRQSGLRSPRRSARKHASALELSARSVRQIPYEELNFHPYKLAMVQELNPRDFIARENSYLFLFVCLFHIYPPFTRKRIVSLYFGRDVRTRLGAAIFEVSGRPVFHIKAEASR